MFRKRGAGFRKLKRYRTIAATLVVYGFEDILIRLNLAPRRITVRKLGKTGRDVSRKPFEVRLRLLLQDLGPTFVKLGQAMSLRNDIFPLSITKELEMLQSAADPFPPEEARSIIEGELGRSVDKLFEEFEDIPVAAASIAQVHRAKLPGGKAVAVKIQRPGITSVIGADLGILRDLVQLAERSISAVKQYRLSEVVERFARTLELELDFRQEGRTIDLFRKTFEEDKTVRFPVVRWPLTTEKVLVMDFMEGIKLSEVERIEAEGFDRSVIARRVAEYVFSQIFHHGFFNADPHPGNFLVSGDNILAPLDFGMTGYLDDEMRAALFAILRAFTKRDAVRLVRAFQQMGIVDDETVIPEFRRNLNNLIFYYYDMPLAHVSVERIFDDLHGVLRRHHISLPPDLALTFKALLTVEGLAKALDESFNVVETAEPFVKRYAVNRFDPKETVESLGDFVQDVYRLIQDMPYDLGTIIRKTRDGSLGINMNIRNIDRFTGEVDRSFNRLSFSIVIAGILVGSSFMVQAEGIPRLFGVSVVSLVGYIGAAVLGLWLVIGIIRSGRL